MVFVHLDLLFAVKLDFVFHLFSFMHMKIQTIITSAWFTVLQQMEEDSLF